MIQEQRWEFHPPPGASFQMHPNGIQLSFAKGIEIYVEGFLRSWLGVYESSARHKAPPGAHGETWPVWPALKPQPPQGLSHWLMQFPKFARVHMVPGMSFPGGIAVDVTRGAPGSIFVQFPFGREQAVLKVIRDSLDKATGHTDEEFRVLASTPPKGRIQRSTRHMMPAVPVPPVNAKPNPISQARRLGDAFFAKLGIDDLEVQEDAEEAVPEYGGVVMPPESPIAKQIQNAAHQEALRKLASLPLEIRQSLSPELVAEIDPYVQGANHDTIPTPAPPAMQQLPLCTCAINVTSLGAHSEGCPAEGYPPHMVGRS
jgi:hypothetical protein